MCLAQARAITLDQSQMRVVHQLGLVVNLGSHLVTSLVRQDG